MKRTISIAGEAIPTPKDYQEENIESPDTGIDCYVEQLRKWLVRTNSTDDSVKFRPLIVCMDNFMLSVQASHLHYCSPRESLPNGEYKSLEVGMPSYKEPLLMKYAENERAWKHTIYAYVPIEVVAEVIKKHGGMRVWWKNDCKLVDGSVVQVYQEE